MVILVLAAYLAWTDTAGSNAYLTGGITNGSDVCLHWIVLLVWRLFFERLEVMYVYIGLYCWHGGYFLKGFEAVDDFGRSRCS